MKKINILLCDPRHNTVGSHSNYIPIGIGYIASFLKAKIKNVKLEIKLSTDPNEILEYLNTCYKDSASFLSFLFLKQELHCLHLPKRCYLNYHLFYNE